jgi:hypothetical protein
MNPNVQDSREPPTSGETWSPVTRRSAWSDFLKSSVGVLLLMLRGGNRDRLRAYPLPGKTFDIVVKGSVRR